MAQNEYMAGMLRVLILAELAAAPGYGYGIARGIGEKSGGELSVRAESLYPVLHRMEQDGLLKAKWEQSEAGRPRKMYSLTPKGRRRFDKARGEFTRQAGGALKALAAAEPAAEGS